MPIHWLIALAITGAVFCFIAVGMWRIWDERGEAVLAAIPGVALLAACAIDVVRMIA